MTLTYHPMRARGSQVLPVRRAIWIDDQPKSVSAHAFRLRSFGWDIKVKRPEDDYMSLLPEVDAVLLDLRWSATPAGRTKSNRPVATSKKLAQLLSTWLPAKPILFVSNVFAGNEYGNIEREISPAAVTARVDRHAGARTSGESYDIAIVDEIRIKLDKLVQAAEDITGPAHSADVLTQGDAELEQYHGILDVSLAEYYAMSHDQRLDLTMRAGSLVRSLVEYELDHSSADWILMGGVPPRVVLWGDYAHPPSDDEIENIAISYGAVPFLFNRPEYIF